MSIVSIYTDFAGQIGANPRRVKIVTTDNLATVTTAGWLNNNNLQGYQLYPTDFIDMVYSYNGVTNSGTNDVFLVSITNSVITLSQDVSGGNVILPVVDGNFATFSGTAGKTDDSGYAPSNAAKTVVPMLDAVPVANNLSKFTAIDGTVGDAGFRVISNTTAAYAGGGTSNAFTATGLTVNAKGSAVIRASTNSVSITKALPGTNTLTITFSADPGAATTVDYIYTTAASA